MEAGRIRAVPIYDHESGDLRGQAVDVSIPGNSANAILGGGEKSVNSVAVAVLKITS